MVKPFQQHDPFFEREQQKYDKPVPSREFIKAQLIEIADWCSEDTLISHFGLNDPDEVEAFTRRLRAMARAHQLRQNRKGLYAPPDTAQLVQGTVTGLKDGYGLLSKDHKGQSLYIDPRQMRGLFPGDEVTLKPGRLNARDRLIGDVVEVLKRNTDLIVGVLEQSHGKTVVMPVNPSITIAISIDRAHLNKAKTGDYVLVEILQQPEQYHQSQGKITSVLGDDHTPGIEAEVMMHAHGLPHEWPKDVLESIDHYSDQISQHDRDTREDITALPLITIDGEDARDFDDAVYCEATTKGLRLVVAIADVSAFVPEDSPIDLEASKRGTSTYFPYRVVPMLPEILSNDLCSLRPDVERLAMVCDMHISAKGQLKDYRFYPGIIKSHARLTYTEVAQMLHDEADYPQGLAGPIQALYQVYQALLKAKEKRGALDFDSQEIALAFDEFKQVTHAYRVPRTDAHRLIEECMLSANVAAANFLTTHHYPSLYRVHEGPTPEKLNDLHRFLNAFGVSMGGKLSPHPKDFSKLLQQVRTLPEANMLQTVILRSLKQAVYSLENKGHFGLAHDEYLHFTSPIRRYPDLLVHRSIKAILRQEKVTPVLVQKRLVQAEHCSMTERRAEIASRECVSWLKCQYMHRHLGQTFAGTVTGVMGFGLFIAIDDNGIEGLVHVSQLGNDYFEFDTIRQQMIGSRTKKRYRIGDAVTVTVDRVSIADRQIDFSLVTDTPAKPRRRNKSRRQR